MGYTTHFTGNFSIDKRLHPKLQEFLTKLNQTRRMKRKLSEQLYGTDGEFFVNGTGYAGQDKTPDVTDENNPPKTQPGLWCRWKPADDGWSIEWDGGEKFYFYVEWLRYLIDKILAPNGYVVNGEVAWQGEDSIDNGTITVKDNEVDPGDNYR